MNKFKKLLFTTDEEDLSNFDALCMFIFHLVAWTLIFVFVRFI